MPKPSIYASKCKVCGVEIAKGEDIRNYGTHWCKYEVCARSKLAHPTTAQAPPQVPPQAQPAQAPPVQAPPAMQPTLMVPPTTVGIPKKEMISITEVYATLDLFEIAHNKAWALATKKALEALPNDKDKVSRHILAQVIYKEAMSFLGSR